MEYRGLEPRVGGWEDEEFFDCENTCETTLFQSMHEEEEEEEEEKGKRKRRKRNSNALRLRVDAIEGCFKAYASGMCSPTHPPTHLLMKTRRRRKRRRRRGRS